MFVGYSTTPGQISPISKFDGTDFFKILGDCLHDYFNKMPLDEIYTKVTQRVACRGHKMTLEGIKTEMMIEHRHVPQKLSTLTNTLYFTNDKKISVSNYKTDH